MSDIAVRVEGLSKQYRIGGKVQPYSTLQESVSQFVAKIAGALSRNGRSGDRQNLFWALKNVSLEVNYGEVVGIIGRNGAGKSTLLKILTQITSPTEGRAEIHGRVASLLEVGTGFHPELTGRENIYLNGAILGMRRAEIDRRFDEIVAFSGIEEFIDTPVKRYSSGMYVRLAFAVAAHLEPEILLVDEVLAVGDAAFQRKCLGKMGDVAESGRTVLLVSHNMEAIRRLCERAIWLDCGSKRADGPSEQVIRQYLDSTADRKDLYTLLAERSDRKGNGRLRFTGFQLRDATGNPIRSVGMGETVEFVLSYIVPEGKPVSNVMVWFYVADHWQRRLLFFSSNHKGENFASLPAEGRIVCRVPRFPLKPGRYSVDLGSSANLVHSDVISEAAVLEVVTGDFFGTGRAHPGSSDFVCDHDWSFDRREV